MRTPSYLRVLCLGNDILADDRFGLKVAEQLRQLALHGVEIVEAATSGFDLLDYTLDTPCLIVVDTVQTGKADPGTIYELREGDLLVPKGNSPHYIGLFEALAAGRKLNLPVAPEMVILAVEAFDCLTIGGQMHHAVEGAIPVVVNRIQELLRQAMSPSPRGPHA
jgi:hydrogenase maturation protease